MSQSGERHNLELLLRIAEFGRLVSQALQRTAGGAEVTDNVAVNVLCHLELSGPLRPNDIVDRTGMTSGGVTKVITRLENAELAQRERHALDYDKRAVSVSLTKRGHDLMRRFAHELGLRIDDAGPLVKEMHKLLS